MKTRSRLCLFAATLLFSAITSFFFLMWALSPDVVTAENAARIKVGMNENEVIAVLSGRSPDQVIRVANGETWKEWSGSGHAIWVVFDRAGRVTEVDFGETEPWYEAFLGRLFGP